MIDQETNLTIKQRRLAEAKVKGFTDQEACKEAGYKAKSDQAACNQVARMMKNDEFIDYLKTLREESRSKAVKSAQDVKEDLSALMDHAKDEKDYTAYVSLAGRLAKMEGHDQPERMQMEFEVTIGGEQEDQQSL